MNVSKYEIKCPRISAREKEVKRAKEKKREKNRDKKPVTARVENFIHIHICVEFHFRQFD